MDWKKQTISLMLAGCMTASALPAAFAVEAQAETPVPVNEAVAAQPEAAAPAQDIQQETPQPIVSAQAAQPQTSVQGAKSGKCGANVTWTLDDKGTLTISGTGKMENYTTGDDNYAPWHDLGEQIKSVVIKPGVTSIGDGAFCDCGSLTGITIPNSVTSIGGGAFSWCGSLTGVTIPNSVTSIGDGAFCVCERLTGITLPNRVTSIGDSMFDKCFSLKSITIPNSVTSIGDSAFSDCDSLTSITIPNSVTSIGDCAFERCRSLTGITLPGSLTSIGMYAFSQCRSLTSIEIPSGVTGIGYEAFDGCSCLTSIAVDGQNRVYSSKNGVLFDKKKTELIHCPQNKSGEFVIPNSVTSIGEGAFSWCGSLTDITLPNSVTSIGKRAFEHCTGLTSITISNSVTSIGEGAFHYCTSLTSVTIPNGVTSIGEGAFEGCESLTSVTIPNSVTSIGDSAFSYCTRLEFIYFCGDAPARGSNVFEGVAAVAYYPQGNRTWTESARERFGGDITWKTWIPGNAKKPVTQVFPDVPADAWYVNAVQYAYDNGIMAGTGGKFMPNGTMTRAMVVQTLYNISGKPAVSGKLGFSDVKTTDWYCKAVLWAEKNKVAAGSNGKFNPNGLVTREQFAQFLYNYAGSPKASGELRGFADTASVSGWAKNALTWANQKGIVSGKPSGGKMYLDPKGKATRAEAATMLMKYQKM